MNPAFIKSGLSLVSHIFKIYLLLAKGSPEETWPKHSDRWHKYAMYFFKRFYAICLLNAIIVIHRKTEQDHHQVKENSNRNKWYLVI